MYKKSQFAALIFIIMIIPVIGILLLYFLKLKNLHLLSALSGFFVILILLFFKLTVKVNQQRVKLIFGIGIIRLSFNIEQVESTKVVDNPWYYGWGIHMIPDGWIYNVSGKYAVELKMKNGKKYRIGTAEPEKLKQIIEKRAESS